MAAPAYMSCKTQEEWKAYLQNLVKTNDKALLRSILVIYNNQTDEEQVTGESTEENDVGFTKWDAKEMTAIAKKIQRHEALTKGELAKSRNKMCKYWKQLMVVSQKTVARKQEEEYNRLRSEREEQFRTINDAMCRCMEEGTACEYGICDECIVHRGIQIRLEEV